VINCPICRQETNLSEYGNRIENLTLNIPLSNIVEHFRAQEVQQVLNPQGALDFRNRSAPLRFPPTGPGFDYSFLSLPQFGHLASSNLPIPNQAVNIVPIKVGHTSALKIFRQWISQLWFAPSDLLETVISHGPSFLMIRYIPFYALDYTVNSVYEAKINEELIVSKYGSFPQHQSKQTVKSSHCGLQSDLICASESNQICQILDKFQYPDFDTISSINCPVIPDEALPWFVAWKNMHMDKRMLVKETEKIREILLQEAPSIDSLMVTCRFSNVVYKLIYFPFYVSTYQYASEEYLFAVSAQTGQIIGGRPYGCGTVGGVVNKVKNWFL